MRRIESEVERNRRQGQEVDAVDELSVVRISAEPRGSGAAVAPEDAEHRPSEVRGEGAATFVEPVTTNRLNLGRLEANAKITGGVVARGQTEWKTPAAKLIDSELDSWLLPAPLALGPEGV
jgi:hypothetical protein